MKLVWTWLGFVYLVVEDWVDCEVIVVEGFSRVAVANRGGLEGAGIALCRRGELPNGIALRVGSYMKRASV